MKREGRQHGLVRCHQIIPQPLNPRPESRYLNRFDSPPTAGLFTRVSTKPTNHSKFTSKCGRPRCRQCHHSPAQKSKDKTKGTQKHRSSNVAGLVSWRIVDARTGSKLSGFSASWLLDRLDGEFYGDDDDDDCLDEAYEKTCETASADIDIKKRNDDNENDDTSFCDMEFVCDDGVDEDEGWCLVKEMK